MDTPGSWACPDALNETGGEAELLQPYDVLDGFLPSAQEAPLFRESTPAASDDGCLDQYLRVSCSLDGIRLKEEEESFPPQLSCSSSSLSSEALPFYHAGSPGNTHTQTPVPSSARRFSSSTQCTRTTCTNDNHSGDSSELCEAQYGSSSSPAMGLAMREHTKASTLITSDSEDCCTNGTSKKLKLTHAGTSNASSKAQMSQSQVRKLSERITALQQLVSPFGKTDTASVLLEAIGYIKFLQDQVQVLSSPYLTPKANIKGCEGGPDLRSRGLCLVPVSCTLNVANSNGADYWISGISGGCGR